MCLQERQGFRCKTPPRQFDVDADHGRHAHTKKRVVKKKKLSSVMSKLLVYDVQTDTTGENVHYQVEKMKTAISTKFNILRPSTCEAVVYEAGRVSIMYGGEQKHPLHFSVAMKKTKLKLKINNDLSELDV